MHKSNCFIHSAMLCVWIEWRKSEREMKKGHESEANVSSTSCNFSYIFDILPFNLSHTFIHRYEYCNRPKKSCVQKAVVFHENFPPRLFEIHCLCAANVIPSILSCMKTLKCFHFDSIKSLNFNSFRIFLQFSEQVMAFRSDKSLPFCEYCPKIRFRPFFQLLDSFDTCQRRWTSVSLSFSCLFVDVLSA